jgi:hypothetical protein
MFGVRGSIKTPCAWFLGLFTYKMKPLTQQLSNLGVATRFWVAKVYQNCPFTIVGCSIKGHRKMENILKGLHQKKV